MAEYVVNADIYFNSATPEEADDFVDHLVRKLWILELEPLVLQVSIGTIEEI